MEINNEELKKDLEEQYAMLEEEVQEDKKKKRYLILLIFFLIMFLVIFGTSFSYFKKYNQVIEVKENECLIKELYIVDHEDEFKFDCSVENYALSITNKEKILNFKYTLLNSKITIDIVGNDDLQVGMNEIKIIVKDEDNNEKIYIIYVTVEDENFTNLEDGNNNTSSSNNDTITNNNDNNNNNNNNNNNDNNNDNNDNINNELFLKDLNVTNHSMNYPFIKERISYIVNDIKSNENKIVVNFELMDNSNTVELKLNGSKVTRIPTKNDNINSIYFNVYSELIIGANKLEIIVKDNNGNEKTYYLFLVVNKESEEQKVIEITVEYGNDNGKYFVSDIIPGWESAEKQYIKVTNTSNYDIDIDLSWTNVVNNFVNTSDLQYTLYKDNKILKTSNLPTKDEEIITNLKLDANSTNNYYISYKYIYRETDQNADQGKDFRTEVKVTLSK